MVNYKLATSNNVTLGLAPAASMLCRLRGVVHQVVTVVKQIDHKAHAFFDAQASTRGRKVEQVEWGFESHAGF